MISSASSEDECLSSTCLRFGSVTMDETLVLSLGSYETDDFTLTLSNSKSFSRVAFVSDKAVLKVGLVTLHPRVHAHSMPGLTRFSLSFFLSFFFFSQIDVVAPPHSWGIPVQDTAQFSHINLSIESISLNNKQGILGETADVKFDADGNPIMKASGEDGKGLLSHEPEYYIVPTLYSPLPSDTEN